MTTWNINDVPACPTVGAGDNGATFIVDDTDNNTAEAISRAACIRLGGQTQMVSYPMSGKDVKRASVLNTVTLACQIGAAISHAKASSVDVVETLKSFFASLEEPRYTTPLFDGKITDIRRETRDGFAFGTVYLSSLDEGPDRLTLDFQNEFLVARLNGQVAALTPDLIVMLDRETYSPITTENIKYGQRVKILTVSVPAVMRSARALEVFGPAAFGYDLTYTPVEEISLKTQELVD